MAGEVGCDAKVVGWTDASADSSAGIMKKLFLSYPSNLALEFSWLSGSEKQNMIKFSKLTQSTV